MNAKPHYDLTTADISTIEGYRRKATWGGGNNTTMYYCADLEAAAIRKFGQERFERETKAGREKANPVVLQREREAKEAKRAATAKAAKDKWDAGAAQRAAIAASRAEERSKADAAAARKKARTEARLKLYAEGELRIDELTGDELATELRNNFSIEFLRKLDPDLKSVAFGGVADKAKRLRKAEAAKQKAQKADQLAAKRKAAEPAEPAAAAAAAKKPRLETAPAAASLPSLAVQPSPAPAVLPAASPAATPAASPTADALDDADEYEVESVVRAGWAGRPNRSKRQYFVKWKGYPASENTWEPAANLKGNEHFAAFLAAD